MSPWICCITSSENEIVKYVKLANAAELEPTGRVYAITHWMDDLTRLPRVEEPNNNTSLTVKSSVYSEDKLYQSCDLFLQCAGV